ncbi:Hydrogen peroxide-inducible genes activator [bacterium YEK0313]|nr:Hydrogen peroxide-inducible genes activator [bacterium YEK0313]
MNIRFLETAIRLAELRNFRATAERLNITAAAISNRIAAMEQELGFKLFERDSREVSTTRQGAIFVDEARDIVARYTALIERLDPSQAVRGSVRLGLPPSMAIALLPRISATLKAQFPDIRFTVVTDAGAVLRRKLEAGELDIAFVVTPSDAGMFRVVDLCTLGMAWVASPDLLRHDLGEVLTPEDLAGYPIISYEAGSLNDVRLVDYFAGHGAEEPVLHRSNSLATTVGMAVAGIGITVLPPVTVQRELAEGSLCLLTVTPVFPPTSYAALYLPTAGTRLAQLVAAVAVDAAAAFCRGFDDALARRP